MDRFKTFSSGSRKRSVRSNRKGSPGSSLLRRCRGIVTEYIIATQRDSRAVEKTLPGTICYLRRGISFRLALLAGRTLYPWRSRRRLAAADGTKSIGSLHVKKPGLLT